jgi:hypothetical protein
VVLNPVAQKGKRPSFLRVSCGRSPVVEKRERGPEEEARLTSSDEKVSA